MIWGETTFVSPTFLGLTSPSLGKTIQTLTRIVEGKPKKSDKEDGWSASTL